MNRKKILTNAIVLAVSAGLLSSSLLTSKPVLAAEEVILNSNFENSTEGWTSYGNCYLMTASWTKNSGNQSLYVANRQNNLSGALYSLKNKVQVGNTYKISTYWMSWQVNNNEKIKLTLSYKDNTGNTKYQTIAQNTVPSGQWTNLSGNVTIPDGAVDPAIYFETAKSSCDYYLDDVVITQLGNNNQEPTQNQNPNQNVNQNPNINAGNSGSVHTTPDEYMKNVKITTDCPSSNSSKRNGVAYGSFAHKTYYSNTTKSTRGFNIMLPANYNPQKKYPVLYVLHGIFGNENSLLGNNIPEIVANNIADGKAKDMIVVLPNMYAATNGASPSFTDAGVAGYDNFVNELENDLMPYIAKNYSVSTAREDQAIYGFSMGGRESLFIGLTRSDLFGYVGAVAPAPGVTPGQDSNMHHKGQLQESELKVAKPDQAPYLIMLCAGTSDSVVGKFPESYHNILTRNNQNHIWYTIPGADHDNRAIQSGLNNYVAAIFHASK